MESESQTSFKKKFDEPDSSNSQKTQMIDREREARNKTSDHL